MEALSILAALLFFLGFFPYGIAVWRGPEQPMKSSWLIWFSNDFILTMSMAAKGTLNYQMIGVTSGSLVILLLAFKFGKPGWSKLDKTCLALAALGIILWVLLKDPMAAMITSLVVLGIGTIPTFRSVWEDPSKENRLAWSLFWLSCILAVLAIPQWTLGHYLQPIGFLAIETPVLAVLFFKPRQA